MKAKTFFGLTFGIGSLVLPVMLVVSVQAAVVKSGDVIGTGPTCCPPRDPNDPANWNTGSSVLIGTTSDGAVTVNGGSTVNMQARVGRNEAITGTLTVDGPGSTWTGPFIAGGDSATGALGFGGTGIINILNGGTMITTGGFVGYYPGATGILNITNGGHLEGISGVGAGVTIGRLPGSSGMATVDGIGSTLRIDGVTTGSGGGNGVLRVMNGGSVINDSVARIGGILDGTGGTGLVIVDGPGSQYRVTGSVPGWNGQFLIGQGGNLNGTLQIRNGGTAGSVGATLGVFSGASGRVAVDGPGSSLAIGTGNLVVGDGSSFHLTGPTRGLVTVTNGAALSVQSDARLAITASSVGTMHINGAGSTMSSTGTVGIGQAGTGRVSVTDGAALTANAVTIGNSNSLLTVDASSGSGVTIGSGTGTLTNDGTVRMVAKATGANGTYAPISAGTWTGTGTVQALGGIYNAATHSVTVSSAATGQAGIVTTIDRSVTQRILITDGATGKSVGAGFQAALAPANLSLTASLMNNSQLNLLQGLLDPGKAILSGWDFSATGYTAGDPVYLSLQIGGGQKFYDLDVWHFDGTGWGKYLNTDLAYDNTFASFVATGFSGYAVSGVAAVPVPAAIWLFGSSLAAMLGLARQRMEIA